MKLEIEVRRTERATLFFAWEKVFICLFCIVSMPVFAQNMASIEVPHTISFVYGFGKNPEHYTQIKPNVGFFFGGGYLVGDWLTFAYDLTVEHRYYYNIIKRQLNGKNTLHKSANFFSVKPSWTYITYKNEFGRNNNYRYYCSVNWGLRRSMGKRFYFDGSIGAGPAYFRIDNDWLLLANLYLGIGFKLF